MDESDPDFDAQRMMEEEAMKQVEHYEEFLEVTLKKDLRTVAEERAKVQGQIDEYLKLQNNIELLVAQDLKEFKTKVDLGMNVFATAKVFDPSTRFIYVNVGFGFHAELTLEESLEFISRKVDHLGRLFNNLDEEVASKNQRVIEMQQAIEQLKKLSFE